MNRSQRRQAQREAERGEETSVPQRANRRARRDITRQRRAAFTKWKHAQIRPTAGESRRVSAWEKRPTQDADSAESAESAESASG